MTNTSTRLIAAVLLLGWAQAASAQTVEDVIEKHLTAAGGRAAIEKLKSRTMTGTITVSTPGGDISGPIELVNQEPNKSRMLIKLDLSSFGAGELTIDQRFDGTVAHVADSMQGNRDITGSQLENMKNTPFPNPFLNYKERGVAIELGGKEKVGDRDALVLVFKPKTGPVARLFLDAGSYLPIKLVVKVELPQEGEVEQTTEFSDYRDLDGVKVPFLLKATSSVQQSSITITKVEHNTKVDVTLFTKPGAER